MGSVRDLQEQLDAIAHFLAPFTHLTHLDLTWTFIQSRNTPP